MKKLRKWLISVLSVAAMLAVGLGFALAPETVVSTSAADLTYTVSDYVPSTADEYDPYGAMGDINPADGDGVTTFAHAGLKTPLEGANISMNTSFTLLPKTTVDGWLTYSFTSSPVTADSQIPNYGANAKGIFFHITNNSSANAPNCVEVQFVQNNGSNVGIAASVFLDNAVGVAINFSLAKQSDGTYTWKITRLSDNVVLKTVSGLAFDESLFVNANGQTYFSTALYGSDNGNAPANRGLNVYSVKKYAEAYVCDTTGFFVRDYVPTTADELDFFGTMSDVDGGVHTWANAGLNIPLEGANVSMDTTFTLLPKTTTDGWLTYSFTSSPVAADSAIPNYTGNAKGIFFHITNCSSANAPNCAEVQLVQNNGSNVALTTVFLDNAIGEKINFNLTKQEDGNFTWTVTRLSDGANLKTLTDIAFDEGVFLNNCGQTYFSTFMYGSENGDASANRGVTVYSVGLYEDEKTATSYKPTTSDITDYYNTVSVYKGSTSYYSHVSLDTALDGADISVTSTFSLLSANTTANGGDGVDGWVTYSFSPYAPTQDSQIPYASGSSATGLYFQFTNYSGTSAPNCVQMCVGYMNNGVLSPLLGGQFVDNILGYRWTLSMKKTATNTYDVAFINEDTGVTVWSFVSILLDESLFVNADGNTYFSSALYGSEGDNGARYNRRVSLHAVNARGYYLPKLDVTMDADSYTYTYGSVYEPVTAVSVNDTALALGTDYTVTYINNDMPGTATVEIDFLGKYSTIPQYVTTFEIVDVAHSGDLKTAVDALQASFEMHGGAAVKMSTPTGLRFGATLDLDALNTLKNTSGVISVEAGMIILPYDYLGVGELPRLDSGRVVDQDILVIPCTILEKDYFTGTFYGAITNIKEANYNRQFSARAYITYTVGGTVTKTYTIYAETNDNVRSVNYVSYAALLDAEADYGDGKSVLQNFVDVTQASYGADIKYVTYMITNKNVDEIESYIQRMKAIHGENDATKGRMYAFGVPGPFPLSQSVEEMRAMVEKCFTLAEKYNVPVFFQVDDMTNYINLGSWAEEQFGNDSLVKFYEHPEMCEWVAFPEEGEEYGGQNAYGRLPRWYFNWGDEASTTACPNLASPQFRELLQYQMQEGFLKPLAAKLKTLKASGKSYLFAGCNIGWETQIPDYSADSLLSSGMKTLEDWEKTEYGYAALHTLGYTAESLAAEAAVLGKTTEQHRKDILYGVIHDFIEFVAKLVYDAGIPRDLIYTHTIANGTVDDQYDTMMPPLWVAINDYSTPGYTMANGNWDQTELVNTLSSYGKTEYIIAEGYKNGYNGSYVAARNYISTQFKANCRNITAFGYDQEDTADKSADNFECAVNAWLGGSL